MENKPSIMEYVWIGLAVVLFFMSIQTTVAHGFSKAYVLYILTAASVAMLIMRRSVRKNIKKDEE